MNDKIRLKVKIRSCSGEANSRLKAYGVCWPVVDGFQSVDSIVVKLAVKYTKFHSPPQATENWFFLSFYGAVIFYVNDVFFIPLLFSPFDNFR